MSGFRNWYVRNQDAITWFIIGWCVMAAITDLNQGQYIWAAFNALIAFGNYKLANIRLN